MPAFSEVYRAHFSFVWRTLARMGVREAELEDAAQEVFVVVHRRMADTYDPARPIRPWLGGIAVRVAAAERRRARHRREQLTDRPQLGQACSGPTPEGVALQRQRAGRVREALAYLDHDRRAVFVMYEMEGLQCTEIADALEVPVNTVYSRLRIARQRFAATVRRLRVREGEV
jgi:RNA polymerase sigma-70 factor (ECF subfamily)